MPYQRGGEKLRKITVPRDLIARGTAEARQPPGGAGMRTLHCTQDFGARSLLTGDHFESMRARDNKQDPPPARASSRGNPMPLVQADRLTRIGAALLRAAGASGFVDRHGLPLGSLAAAPLWEVIRRSNHRVPEMDLNRFRGSGAATIKPAVATLRRRLRFTASPVALPSADATG